MFEMVKELWIETCVRFVAMQQNSATLIYDVTTERHSGELH